MTGTSLTAEDCEFIRDYLLTARASGTQNPLLPAEVDQANGGVITCFGLDADDCVHVVEVAELDDTLYESNGDDIGGDNE